MTYRHYKKAITEKLDRRDLLEQLAEESAELSQAALKCIRAEKLSNNGTTTTEPQATANLLEEISDVLLVLETLDMLNATIAGVRNNPKWERWATRLDELAEQERELKMSDKSLEYMKRLVENCHKDKPVGVLPDRLIELVNEVMRLRRENTDLNVKLFLMETIENERENAKQQ